MKKLLLALLTLATTITATAQIKIGTANGSQSILLEEGRTWWYSYQIFNPDHWDPIWVHRDFGLTLQNPENIDGETWFGCFVVADDGNLMLDTPIAWLRQTGDEVYVKPHTLTPAEEATISEMPDRFWHVYRIFLSCRVWDSWEALTPEGEYLLYDWRLRDGDRIEYPWIYDFDDIEKITIVSSATVENRMTWEGTWGWNDHVLIVEGIGNVAGRYNTGTFLYPCCYRQITADMNGVPDWVSLQKVTDKDGKTIYEPWTAGIDTTVSEKLTNGGIYDLHGRKVTNPVPGTIYVRDGRKFVAR